MPTRLLVVGNGAREHALAWKLAAEPGVNAVIVAPGRDVMANEPRVRTVRLEPLDPEAVVALARAQAVEVVVVGPEAPLATGVADALTAAGVPVFGPSAAAARIETSKGFCREVAGAAGIPMAEGRAFGADERGAAISFARQLVDRTGGAVIKADGLAAGKGVTVCTSADEAEVAVDALDGRVVVEERLVGREASVIALSDGADAIALPISRDHKRLGDGDTGPNTGGMGAYSPLPDLPDDAADEIVERFHRPALAELARRGTPFRGALYAGLMLTDRGPRLLEFNARFGDPETQVIVPRLAVALGPLLLAAARGSLADARRAYGSLVPALPTATVGIVLASKGYPNQIEPGAEITALDDAGRLSDEPDVLVFHAGSARGPDGRFRATGGRVLTVVGRGADLGAARGAAERAADRVAWPGSERRHDIAGEAATLAGASA
ncbi:MAG TPA: phosphoribosylamine--glycine ligase [Candidatus Limnocylindrales bacterium]|nr:phosphoribosylamine--glycine ligase [Candidatus Limnocylindrales bacterium]